MFMNIIKIIFAACAISVLFAYIPLACAKIGDAFGGDSAVNVRFKTRKADAIASGILMGILITLILFTSNV